MPDRFPPDSPKEWMNRARSSLALASVNRDNAPRYPGTFPEIYNCSFSTVIFHILYCKATRPKYNLEPVRQRFPGMRKALAEMDEPGFIVVQTVDTSE